MDGHLVLGSNWRIVMEAAEVSFNVAGHVEEAFEIKLVSMEDNVTEKGTIPINGYFVTRIGLCVVEKIWVFLQVYFTPKIVNNEREGEVSACVLWV